MPYISPASSTSSIVANYFNSPPGSNPSSPGSGRSRSGSNSVTSSTASSPTTPSSSNSAYTVMANPVEFDSSYARGFPATSTSKRPSYRHHSRSHSSDALSSSVNGYRSGSSSYASQSSSSVNGSVKSTPGYIFVHPASPATSADASTSYNHYGRPSLRHSGSSRTSSSSVSTVTPADDGDVAPPRSSSSRRKKFHISSADSSPRMSMSLENGQAFQLPLPDLDAMSPPAYSNRRSSVQFDEDSIHEEAEGERTPPASTAVRMNGYHDSFITYEY